jgi:hypothetical protein
MEAAANPLPSEESTPPVTKMNLVRVDFVGCMANTIATWQLIGQEKFFINCRHRKKHDADTYIPPTAG